MKRLIKLLSIFGVLIILGSCSSSKSVNVSDVVVGDGILEVKFIPQFTYDDMFIIIQKYNASTGQYEDQGYADINSPMLLNSEDTLRIYGTFRYTSGSIKITDYINNVPLNLDIHYSANRRKITYKIYDDGSIFPSFD